MNKKLKTLIAAFTIALNLVYAPALVLAEIPPIPTVPTIPTAPSAPTAPVANYTIPTVPTIPEVPKAPEAPKAPKPSYNYGGNTGGSNETPTTNTTNTGNGSGSTNTSNSSSNDQIDVKTSNNAGVENNLIVDVNSGKNDASKNMSDGVVVSGNGTVNGSLTNDLNNTFIDLDSVCGCDSGSGAGNTGNGSGSTNNANSSSNSVIDINNINNLYLVNNESLGANTGKNEADKNMGDGVVQSGDANISFTTINFGNNTGIDMETANFDIVDTRSEDLVITWPTGSRSGSGSGVANLGNGAYSDNNANSNTNTSTTINNDNNLLLDNNINIFANTGENSADANMGAGIIQSGDANIANNVINFLNNNIVAGAQWFLSTVNIYGDMSGDIILPRGADLAGCGCASDTTVANTGNGSGSTNSASSTTNDILLVNNLNNAVINNNLNIDSNTGGNSAEKNMGDASISTGNLDVNSNLVTVANTNTVGQGDTWWLVLVNNQGQWTGKITGANDGDTIAGSGIEFGIAPNGSIYALNSGNGADSNNSSSTNSNNTTTINNTNNATINNNININANTGNNSADKNMGGASITTGDVNVASNIVNFINNNFIGKKFNITVVNIFGKFTGNIVTPDQPLPNKNGVGGVAPASVALTEGTTISGVLGKSSAKSGGSSSGFASGTLSEALSGTAKALENTKVAGSNIDKPITKVINHPGSGFSFNLLLLGIALLIVVGSTIIAKRKAS